MTGADAPGRPDVRGKSLATSILDGGGLLVLRYVAIIALKIVGLLLITRALGPANYGTYISVYSVYMLLLGVGPAGIGTYLVRRPGILLNSEIGTASTVLVAQSLAFVAVVQLAARPLAAYVDMPGFEPTLRVIIFAMPLQALSTSLFAQIERSLAMGKVAAIDLLGLFAYYATALAMIAVEASPMVLAVSLIVQYVCTLFLCLIVGGHRLRFAWHPRCLGAILGYAASYSAANYMWQLRSLANPFIVGPIAGAAAVGIIGIAVSVLEVATLLRTMLWRITVAALGKVQDDREQMRLAIRDGMEIQLLVNGTVILGFGWIGHLVVPFVFGERWLPMFELYPYLAVAYLAMATFSMHTAAMAVTDRNWSLTLFQGVHVAVLLASTALFVPLHGAIGYGFAELAALVPYVILHRVVRTATGGPDYMPTLIWLASASIGLFWRDLGLWVIALPFVALLLPVSRARLISYAQLTRRHRKPVIAPSVPMEAAG